MKKISIIGAIFLFVTCIVSLETVHASVFFRAEVPTYSATATFVAPASYNLDGWSSNNFTLNGYWSNFDVDTVNAPYMNAYFESHSVTYDLGTFTFNSATFNGWAWDDERLTNGGTLTVDFKDISGNLIKESTITLPGDNTFYTLSDYVAGVHELFFPATNSFWPRMQSITYTEGPSVPEPSTFLLFGAGIGGLVLLRRKARK